MAQYVLLYRNTNEAYQENMGSPERAKASLAKWRAWFIHIAIGELALRLGRTTEAQRSFGTALGLARNPAERRFLAQRLQATAP